MDLEIDQKFRFYLDDDSHYVGTITNVTEAYVDVDFINWEERFRRSDIGVIEEFYEEFPATMKRGVVLIRHTDYIANYNGNVVPDRGIEDWLGYLRSEIGFEQPSCRADRYGS